MKTTGTSQKIKHPFSNSIHRLFFSTVATIFFVINGDAQTASSTITPTNIVNPNTKLLLGITLDARCGMTGTSGPVGYFYPDGTLVPNIDTLFDDFPLNGVRYPGNGTGVGFDWKNSIGPLPRTSQNILGGMGTAQSVDFGFDEFMTYCESKGLTGEEVQIMVSIYDLAVTYNATQDMQRVPFPASHAADWVEYANAPEGVNWQGGIEWSAFRVTNGHPEPYGIRTWNIGNEPWGPMEMNFDSSLYFPLAGPIIDSMLARDPSIHITIPTAGHAYTDWNYMIRKYAVSHPGIYGISPHCFQDMQMVNTVESIWKILIDSAESVNLKVIAGDFSFEIPPVGATLEDKNRAMSWEGALFSTDMLLMLSQLNTIERANHWVFGMTSSVWHPIRKEIDGTYTMLPVGNMYEILTPYFMQQSLQTISTSPLSADGNPYSLRASSFSNLAGDTISVVAINRDTVSTLSYSISGLAGYVAFSSTLLTADSLTGEYIYSNPIFPDMSGNYSLPPMSILLIKTSSNVLAIEETEQISESDFILYPNPTNGSFHIKLPEEIQNGQLKIYNQLGQLVFEEQNLNGSFFEFDSNLLTGIYSVQLINEETKILKKLIVE